MDIFGLRMLLFQSTNREEGMEYLFRNSLSIITSYSSTPNKSSRLLSQSINLA